MRPFKLSMEVSSTVRKSWLIGHSWRDLAGAAALVAEVVTDLRVTAVILGAAAAQDPGTELETEHLINWSVKSGNGVCE